MARFNKVYAGPVTETLPQVVERLAAVAINPGQMITINGSNAFALAVANTDTKVFIAQDNYLTLKGPDVAWGIGETTIGMEMLQDRLFNARVAATVVVTVGAALALGAAGVLVLATAGSRVVAFAEETVTVGATADLVRVRAATGYRLAA